MIYSVFQDNIYLKRVQENNDFNVSTFMLYEGNHGDYLSIYVADRDR